MNPAQAYEQHTDLVRALTRPDSPERRWFSEYHEGLGFHPVTGKKQPTIGRAHQRHRHPAGSTP